MPFSARKYADLESKIDRLEDTLRCKIGTLQGFADPEICVRRLSHIFHGPGEKVKTNKLTYQKFFAALTSINFVGVQRELEGLFNRYDFDGTGTVDYIQFSRCIFGLGNVPFLDGRSKKIVDNIVIKVVERAGVCGIHSLCNTLYGMDATESHMHDPLELEEVLRDFGAGQASSNDVQKLLSYFLYDGMIDTKEFLKFFKRGILHERKQVTAELFRRVSRTGISCPVKILMSVFDPLSHPSVANRLISSSEAVKHFLIHFDEGEDGIGYWSEFLDYCKGISVAIEDDDAYGLLIRDMFDASFTTLPNAGEDKLMTSGFSRTTRRRLLAVRQDGSSEIVEMLDDTANGRLDKKLIIQHLRDQGMRDVVDVRL